MDRPLSPHLQIYRVQWSSLLSITHRFTGCFLTVGFFAFVFWLWALSDSQFMFQKLQKHISAWYGQVFLLGWSFSLFYHISNGIRHLVWDTGHWLELKDAYRSGIGVIIVSIFMTILTWFSVWYGG